MLKSFSLFFTKLLSILKSIIFLSNLQNLYFSNKYQDIQGYNFQALHILLTRFFNGELLMPSSDLCTKTFGFTKSIIILGLLSSKS